MRKNSTNILTAVLALLFPVMGASAMASDSQVNDDWTKSQNVAGGQTGNPTDEDALLQTLFNEDEDADLAKMLESEDYIFPTSITDNWHLDLQLGAYSSWGSYSGKVNLLKRTSFAAALSLGKYLTPINDLRIRLLYGRGTGVRGADMLYPSYNLKGASNDADYIYDTDYDYDFDHEKALADNHTYHWQTAGISMQWLPNFTTLFCGYKPERKFTLSGIVGIGLEHTWSYTDKQLSIVSVWAEHPRASRPRNLVSLEFGLMADWKLGDMFHLNVELSDNVLDDSYDGLISDQEWDGHYNLMAGLTWYIGNRGDASRNATIFEDKYTPFFDKIKENRDKANDALAARETIIETKDVLKNVTYTLISFDENDIEVPRLQQNNVFQTAETYKHMENSKIFITNSNKIDDSTFHQRAWSISKLLNQRWQIPLEDIWVDADESHIQQLQIPDVKTYIIFIINE